MRSFTGGNTNIENSDFSLNLEANDNKAISRRNSAVSGTQTVLADVSEGSSINENSTTSGNKASVIGSNTDVDGVAAISGSQTLISSLTDSEFV